ncbi:hypothetical protein BMT55_05405 [Listeria newyorkensis]|uniref:Uncharacterized protein n=1 Tax=Listeria newyorkensis TaxID=1497681 RepID=A0ABX4XNS6_9LIST|nr:hypothetical protein EP58_13435 [Listeria newyorkensis]KGL45258.1 hypothetical protein EP56_06790 [Listeriaceae bacterium FSL A5-0209]PNP93431.1 hypothetical protein BMT55_05405 [Listeria newyorkensis]
MYLIIAVLERWLYSTKKMWSFTQKTGAQEKEINDRTLLYKMKRETRKGDKKVREEKFFPAYFILSFLVYIIYIIGSNNVIMTKHKSTIKSIISLF